MLEIVITLGFLLEDLFLRYVAPFCLESLFIFSYKLR